MSPARKPRDLMRFTRKVQRLMASPFMQAVGEDPAETDQAPSPGEQPATPQRREDTAETNHSPNEQPAPNEQLTPNEQPIPNEQPATPSPGEQPATPQRQQKQRSGPLPEFDQEALWQLAKEQPGLPTKQLLIAYRDKTKTEPSLSWVRKHRIRPQ
jgi:hypothetical protein